MRIKRRCLKILKQLIVVCLCVSVVLGIYLLQKLDTEGLSLHASKTMIKTHTQSNNLLMLTHLKLSAASLISINKMSVDHKAKVVKKFVTPSKVTDNNYQGLRLRQFNVVAKDFEPCYQVHAFYYPWYGNPQFDGKYIHWNHQYLLHWNKNEATKWRQDRHIPPDDIGASFYPLLGAYSSKDSDVVDMHMQMMRFAKIGTYSIILIYASFSSV